MFCSGMIMYVNFSLGIPSQNLTPKESRWKYISTIAIFLGRSASLNISFFHFIVTLNIRNHLFTHFPPNIGLDKDVLKTFQRRLEDVFCLRLQDVLVKANTFALVIRIQKKSSRLLGQDQYIRLDHTSSRRLQDICKTSCINVFRHLQDVFKTSSGYLQDLLPRCFQDVLQKRL